MCNGVSLVVCKMLSLCCRWQELLAASQARKERLIQSQEQHKKVLNIEMVVWSDSTTKMFIALVKQHISVGSVLTFCCLQVEDLFLLFAKKASAFNSWFENAEEDLTDPVRCNSVEEIRVCCIQVKCIVWLYNFNISSQWRVWNTKYILYSAN